MDEIMWHRRESRRQTENTNVILQSRESPVYSQRYERRNEEQGEVFSNL